MSDRSCRDCGAPIKKKLILTAKANKHQPPDRCYKCLCKQRNKKTTRERKVILAKERKRKRDLASGSG